MMDMLSLLKRLMETQNLNYTIFKSSGDLNKEFDLGLRNEILKSYDFSVFWNILLPHCKEDILLFFRDSFYCNYAIFQYTDINIKEIIYVMIGPYLTEDMTQSQFYSIQQKVNSPEHAGQDLIEYYNALPKIQETNRFHILISCLVEQILVNPPDFTVQFMTDLFDNESEPVEYAPESPLMSYKLIEERYQLENSLLQAVTQGNFSKAELALEKFIQHRLTPRFKDPLRHSKNLMIVLSTLCRKSVENANVHPFHIDEVSRNFAIQIESLQSMKDVHKLELAILRKYCLLVNNYSLSGHSSLLQKVINYIDMNITEPLSLNTLSTLFSVNSSYLSTLFKKEMGITLTEFIHYQKIQYAIKLLNKTDLQIQNIAAQIGINDVNYFIKMFKKINGMTPKEYRDSIKMNKEIPLKE